MTNERLSFHRAIRAAVDEAFRIAQTETKFHGKLSRHELTKALEKTVGEWSQHNFYAQKCSIHNVALDAVCLQCYDSPVDADEMSDAALSGGAQEPAAQKE